MLKVRLYCCCFFFFWGGGGTIGIDFISNNIRSRNVLTVPREIVIPECEIMTIIPHSGLCPGDVVGFLLWNSHGNIKQKGYHGHYRCCTVCILCANKIKVMLIDFYPSIYPSILHFIDCNPWSSLGEQFLWFSKNYLLRCDRIFPLFTQSNLCFSDVLIKEY